MTEMIFIKPVFTIYPLFIFIYCFWISKAGKAHIVTSFRKESLYARLHIMIHSLSGSCKTKSFLNIITLLIKKISKLTVPIRTNRSLLRKRYLKLSKYNFCYRPYRLMTLVCSSALPYPFAQEE